MLRSFTINYSATKPNVFQTLLLSVILIINLTSGKDSIQSPTPASARQIAWMSPCRVIITCAQTRERDQCHGLLSLIWWLSRILLPDNVHMEPIWWPSELYTCINWYHNLEEDQNFRSVNCFAKPSFIDNVVFPAVHFLTPDAWFKEESGWSNSFIINKIMHQGNEQAKSAKNFIYSLNQKNSTIHYQIKIAFSLYLFLRCILQT